MLGRKLLRLCMVVSMVVSMRGGHASELRGAPWVAMHLVEGVAEEPHGQNPVAGLPGAHALAWHHHEGHEGLPSPVLLEASVVDVVLDAAFERGASPSSRAVPVAVPACRAHPSVSYLLSVTRPDAPWQGQLFP